MPASFNIFTTSSRFIGWGVPGSVVSQTFSSTVPTEKLALTSVTEAPSTSRSRSRWMRVPLVRIEYGFRAALSSVRMARISL
jgi:hypothetical protein